MTSIKDAVNTFENIEKTIMPVVAIKNSKLCCIKVEDFMRESNILNDTVEKAFAEYVEPIVKKFSRYKSLLCVQTVFLLKQIFPEEISQLHSEGQTTQSS